MIDLKELSLKKILEMLKSREITCVQALDYYLDRIEKFDKPVVNAISQLNPDARAIAEALDADYENKKDLPLFGLPMPPAQMDRQIAELFWKWFWENESAIVQLASGSRKESKLLHSQLQLWMGPMFLYVKVNDIDFKVSCHDNVNTFTFNCGGDAQLREDAEVFGDLMHERLKDHWNFIIEE